MTGRFRGGRGGPRGGRGGGGSHSNSDGRGPRLPDSFLSCLPAEDRGDGAGRGRGGPVPRGRSVGGGGGGSRKEKRRAEKIAKKQAHVQFYEKKHAAKIAALAEAQGDRKRAAMPMQVGERMCACVPSHVC